MTSTAIAAVFANCSKGNILPATNAAPALQAHARELEKHMLADNLEHKIQNRPQPEDLIEQGILEEDEDPRSPTSTS
jgi:hypothetical protein